MRVIIEANPMDRIWEKTGEIIKSPETKEEARKNKKYFTRKRGMSFAENVIFVINKGNTSIQTELNRFYENHKKEMGAISEQAFSEARNKYDESPFVKLFNMSVEESYKEENELVKTWNEYYILSVDGTDIVVPQSPEMREKYGEMNGIAVGRGSAIYDVVSERIVCADLGSIHTDERRMAKKQIKRLKELGLAGKSILVYDRGYPSERFIRYIEENGFKYVMRVKKKFNREIDKIEDEGEIELSESVTVRAVKVPLNEGYETLITNLSLSKEELFELYGLRWGIETNYDVLKNKIQVEAFSGLTETAVKQDFYASVFLNNMVLMEKFRADLIIQMNRANKDNKYVYKSNVNEIVGSIKDRFIDICFAENSEDVKKN